jgi:hypothetical protein
LTTDTVWGTSWYAGITQIHASTEPDILALDSQRERWLVIDLKSSKSPDPSYDVKVVELYAEVSELSVHPTTPS